MLARDANNSTWYMLRYPEQFAVSAPDVFHGTQTPFMTSSMFYDDTRHVLELLPESSDREIEPLSGFMVDVTGEIYSANYRTGEITVKCGEHESQLLCETNVFIKPVGLALDRRGYLYVADASAKRVVVILPDDGSRC